MEEKEKGGDGDAVKLRDCLEELVKFTLSSHLNLSSQFCSILLKDDPSSSSSHTQGLLFIKPTLRDPYPSFFFVIPYLGIFN